MTHDLVPHSIVEGRWSSLKACCQKVVDQYQTLYYPPRTQNAALYCPDCHARIICRHGSWMEEA